MDRVNASQSPGVALFVAASRSSSRASPAAPLGNRKVAAESDETIDAPAAAAASQGHVRVAELHSSTSCNLAGRTRAVVVEVEVEVEVETVVAFAFAFAFAFGFGFGVVVVVGFVGTSNRSPLKSIDPNSTLPLGRRSSPAFQSRDALPAASRVARSSTVKGERAVESVAATSAPSEMRSKPSKRPAASAAIAAPAAGVRHAMVDAKLIGANSGARGGGGGKGGAL